MKKPSFILHEDKPETRLASRGVSALLDSELLAVASGLPAESADLAGLLEAFGSITAPSLTNATLQELEAHLPRAKALRLAAVFEVARRIETAGRTLPEKLDEPSKVWKYCKGLFPFDREACLVLALNRRNRLLRHGMISIGTATSALMHPREVFKFAVSAGASAVIICHNHPSGDPTPSPADRAITKQINDAGKVMGIELLDHVIIGTQEADPASKGWFSFGEAGLI
jgi:DNA repair protein RadC